MVKTSFAHKPRLRAYIESRGRRLPTSYNKYVRPGDSDTLCLFCGTMLDGAEHEVQVYYDGIEGAEATGAYMCGICFGPVKEMEAKLAGEKGMGSLFDSFGMGDRLELFAKEVNFQTDVHRHYQHLDEYFEVAPHEVGMCYFCKNVTKHDYFLLKVPVSGADYVDGGNIRCCFTCRDLLLDILVEKNFRKFYENNNITPIECSKCEKEYMITGGELEYRIQSKLLSVHMCTECTLKTIAGAAGLNNPALHFMYTPTVESFLVSRYKYVYCGYCEAGIDIDITLPPTILKSLHISAKGIVMCSNCAYTDAGPITAFVYSGKVWAVYEYDEANPKRYKVVVRTLSGRRLLEKTVEGELPLIILGSYDTITHYADPVQLDLKM